MCINFFIFRGVVWCIQGGFTHSNLQRRFCAQFDSVLARVLSTIFRAIFRSKFKSLQHKMTKICACHMSTADLSCNKMAAFVWKKKEEENRRYMLSRGTPPLRVFRFIINFAIALCDILIAVINGSFYRLLVSLSDTAPSGVHRDLKSIVLSSRLSAGYRPQLGRGFFEFSSLTRRKQETSTRSCLFFCRACASWRHHSPNDLDIFPSKLRTDADEILTRPGRGSFFHSRKRGIYKETSAKQGRDTDELLGFYVTLDWILWVSYRKSRQNYGLLRMQISSANS